MARGGGAVTTKVLSLRELQMAKRMLNQPKVPPCQRELTALLNAMDRKEKGEEVSIRILQTALEHCLQQAVGFFFGLGLLVDWSVACRVWMLCIAWGGERARERCGRSESC